MKFHTKVRELRANLKTAGLTPAETAVYKATRDDALSPKDKHLLALSQLAHSEPHDLADALEGAMRSAEGAGPFGCAKVALVGHHLALRGGEGAALGARHLDAGLLRFAELAARAPRGAAADVTFVRQYGAYVGALLGASELAPRLRASATDRSWRALPLDEALPALGDVQRLCALALAAAAAGSPMAGAAASGAGAPSAQMGAQALTSSAEVLMAARLLVLVDALHLFRIEARLVACCLDRYGGLRDADAPCALAPPLALHARHLLQAAGTQAMLQAAARLLPEKALALALAIERGDRDARTGSSLRALHVLIDAAAKHELLWPSELSGGRGGGGADDAPAAGGGGLDGGASAAVPLAARPSELARLVRSALRLLDRAQLAQILKPIGREAAPDDEAEEGDGEAAADDADDGPGGARVLRLVASLSEAELLSLDSAHLALLVGKAQRDAAATLARARLDASQVRRAEGASQPPSRAPRDGGGGGGGGGPHAAVAMSMDDFDEPSAARPRGAVQSAAPQTAVSSVLTIADAARAAAGAGDDDDDDAAADGARAAGGGAASQSRWLSPREPLFPVGFSSDEAAGVAAYEQLLCCAYAAQPSAAAAGGARAPGGGGGAGTAAGAVVERVRVALELTRKVHARLAAQLGLADAPASADRRAPAPPSAGAGAGAAEPATRLRALAAEGAVACAFHLALADPAGLAAALRASDATSANGRARQLGDFASRRTATYVSSLGAWLRLKGVTVTTAGGADLALAAAVSAPPGDGGGYRHGEASADALAVEVCLLLHEVAADRVAAVLGAARAATGSAPPPPAADGERLAMRLEQALWRIGLVAGGAYDDDAVPRAGSGALLAGALGARLDGAARAAGGATAAGLAPAAVAQLAAALAREGADAAAPAASPGAERVRALCDGEVSSYGALAAYPLAPPVGFGFYAHWLAAAYEPDAPQPAEDYAAVVAGLDGLAKPLGLSRRARALAQAAVALERFRLASRAAASAAPAGRAGAADDGGAGGGGGGGPGGAGGLLSLVRHALSDALQHQPQLPSGAAAPRPLARAVSAGRAGAAAPGAAAAALAAALLGWEARLAERVRACAARYLGALLASYHLRYIPQLTYRPARPPAAGAPPPEPPPALVRAAAFELSETVKTWAHVHFVRPATAAAAAVAATAAAAAGGDARGAQPLLVAALAASAASADASALEAAAEGWLQAAARARWLALRRDATRELARGGRGGGGVDGGGRAGEMGVDALALALDMLARSLPAEASTAEAMRLAHRRAPALITHALCVQASAELTAQLLGAAAAGALSQPLLALLGGPLQALRDAAAPVLRAAAAVPADAPAVDVEAARLWRAHALDPLRLQAAGADLCARWADRLRAQLEANVASSVAMEQWSMVGSAGEAPSRLDAGGSSDERARLAASQFCAPSAIDLVSQLERACVACEALAQGCRLAARDAQPFATRTVEPVVRLYARALADAPPSADGGGAAARGGKVGKGGRGGEAGARADLASSASLEALCVRLNSAAFVEQELVLLSHRLAAATRQPLAGSEPGPLGEAAAECERVAMHLAALISARVVHTELADLWPRLYSRAAQPPAAAAGKASKQPQQRARDEEASRGVGIAALLERMDPFLGVLYENLSPQWASKVLLGVLGALLQATGTVITHRAPLTLAEAEAVRADVDALRTFFVADGAGLPEAEVRSASAVVLKALDAAVDEGFDDAPPARPAPPRSPKASSLASRLFGA